VPLTGFLGGGKRRSWRSSLRFDEVDVGGVDDQEVGGGVAEEKMFVGAGDFVDVFGGRCGIRRGRAFFGRMGRARRTSGLGLEVDDQIGGGNVRGEGFVIALVEA